jgi:lipopolysaccharide/colanic/teichoic acid biosynthesis glycosyltransferase
VRRLARVLLYAGTFLTVIGLGRYHAQFIGNYVFHTSFRLPWSVAYAAVLCIAAYGVGLPDLTRSRKVAVAAALGSTVVAALAISAAQLAVGDQVLPRFTVFASVAVLVPWYVLCADIVRGGRYLAEDRDRVVAVVRDDEAQTLRDELAKAPEQGASLVATMLPDAARPDGPHSKPLVEQVSAVGATVVVLDRDAQAEDGIVEQAAILHENGVRIRTLTLFYDEWLGKLPLNELERISLMFDIGEIHRTRYGRIKRLLDIVVAAIGLLPLLITLPFVLLGNLIANRGPLFYRQERVGRNGATFQIVKFRTMKPGGAASDWTGEDDPRITPFGRLLRRSHLDEVPQVLNVLRGDLSIVGPRPEQPRYVRELTGKIPFYDLRHRVRPGLTGWAQVKYDYGSSDVDALEKLQYEFFYLRHQSLSLDLRIMGRTLRSVLGWGGR